jgi:putative transposase
MNTLLFQNKFRIPSCRLHTWNYEKPGLYFITICTKRNQHFFGEVENAQMQLTELGKIAHQEWMNTIELRPDMNLTIGEFIVMPNHFHAILMIGENKYNRTDAMPRVTNPILNLDSKLNIDSYMNQRDARHRVSTNQFGPQSNNLASIIRGFKSAVTIYARKNNLKFDWHPRFYDHIIRTQIEFINIENYIIKNPAKWEKEKSAKKQNTLKKLLSNPPVQTRCLASPPIE